MRGVILKVLAAAVWALCAVGAAHAERRVALVVGNGAYAHAIKLPNPVNDARDIRERLARLGFDVVEALDVTVDGFDAAVTNFERKASGPDLALFFYAGHGLQFEGTNYLLPIDVKADSDVSLRRRAVIAQDVVNRMERAAKVNLIILDACRNNTLLRDIERGLGESRQMTTRRGLAPMTSSGSNTLIAFATAPDQVAADGNTRNSPFTSALLRHIETPNVSVQDMLTSVAGDVLRDTEQRQKPEVLSRLTRRVELNRQAAGATIPPTAPTPLVVSPSREREASIAWEAAKESCDRDRLSAFRQRYNDTYFGDLAKQRESQIVAGTQCAVAKVEPPKQVATPKVAEPPISVEPQDDRDLIRALQTELKRAGCYDGSIDGTWGNLSAEALKSFASHTKRGALQVSRTSLDAVRDTKSRVCPCDDDQVLKDGVCIEAKKPPSAQPQVSKEKPKQPQSQASPTPTKTSASVEADPKFIAEANRAKLARGAAHYCRAFPRGAGWASTLEAAKANAILWCRKNEHIASLCKVEACR